MSRKIDPAVRRDEIARKAMRLFSQVGYDNVSLIMIASATGISRTVLYRSFCSKVEILNAAIRMATGEVERRSRNIIISRNPTPMRLEHVCHTVVDVLFEYREFFVAVFDYILGRIRTGADMTRAINKYTQGTRLALKRLVEWGKRRGELPSALAAEQTADELFAAFESCAMRIVLGTETESSAARKRFSDLIQGLSAACDK